MIAFLLDLFGVVKCRDCRKWKTELASGRCFQCSMKEIERHTWADLEAAIRDVLKKQS